MNLEELRVLPNTQLVDNEVIRTLAEEIYLLHDKVALLEGMVAGLIALNLENEQ